MAILKIISHNKTNAGMRRLLSYVLDPKKTEMRLCAVTGDFRNEDITPRTVYSDFMRVRDMFEARDGGRVCAHGTVSFAPGEISPEQAADFALDFSERIYPSRQVLIATHTDTGDRVHFHFVVNAVSFADGSMLHSSKKDLAAAKKICNEMCLERGLSIAKKGRHADGSAFDTGEITAWSKNKWHGMLAEPKKCYLADLALAVCESKDIAESREEFLQLLGNEYGWCVLWKENRKNIVFMNAEGKKVRDSNLSKTFNIDISKEALEREFARNGGKLPSEQSYAVKAFAAEKSDRTAESRKQMAKRTAGSCRR